MTPNYNEQSPHPPQCLLPRGRILLVDEEEVDLKSSTALLRHMGFSVRAFLDYRQAEARVGYEHFDFLIVSQGSPAFETQRLVKLALAHNRHTPVVVLTRYMEMSCYLEAMQLGAADYLEKPLAPKQFERLIATHFQPQRGKLTAGNA